MILPRPKNWEKENPITDKLDNIAFHIGFIGGLLFLICFLIWGIIEMWRC